MKPDIIANSGSKLRNMQHLRFGEMPGLSTCIHVVLNKTVIHKRPAAINNILLKEGYAEVKNISAWNGCM